LPGSTRCSTGDESDQIVGIFERDALEQRRNAHIVSYQPREELDGDVSHLGTGVLSDHANEVPHDIVDTYFADATPIA